MSRPLWVVLPWRRLSQPDESCAITSIIAQRTDVQNQKIARLGLRFREYGQGLLKGFYALLPGHGAVAVYCG